MKKIIKQGVMLALTGVLAFPMISCGETNKTIQLKNVKQAKNVILMIGDGMGPTQIRAGELFKGEKLTMQGFPYKTTVQTRSNNNGTTDSAAAATALATGQRTNNGVIGRGPDYQDLETIVDVAHGLGKATGIIATEEIYGATPMGFSGHADNRGDTNDLLRSAATSSNVNLFASSAITLAQQSVFVENGYTNVAYADDISESTADKIIGSYTIKATYDSMMAEGEYVALDRLVTEALEYLSKDEDGFFLMAEGSHIDHGGHNNDICYMLEELIAFDDAIAAVLEWAKNRDDTVVIVTADHETGGLVLERDTTHQMMVDVYQSFGRGGCYEWLTTGHTSTDVNLYINGANINFAKCSFESKDRIKNTDVFDIMKYLMTGK